MPIYDFSCECGHSKEQIVKSTVFTVECPKCGAAMKRTISGAQSFYFKGAGAYCEKSMAPRKHAKKE